MADFLTAHHKTMCNEGGYSFNPFDAGGETYMGISRRFWPKWAGWRHIDTIKSGLTSMPAYNSTAYYQWVKFLNKQASGNPALQALVVDFYRTNFWNSQRLGEIINQSVANKAYDWHVNAGATGIKWIQEAAGATPDGEIGPLSLGAINSHDPDQLIAKAIGLARAHRMKVVKEHPSQEVFLAGWLKRDALV